MLGEQLEPAAHDRATSAARRCCASRGLVGRLDRSSDFSPRLPRPGTSTGSPARSGRGLRGAPRARRTDAGRDAGRCSSHGRPLSLRHPVRIRGRASASSRTTARPRGCSSAAASRENLTAAQLGSVSRAGAASPRAERAARGELRRRGRRRRRSPRRSRSACCPAATSRRRSSAATCSSSDVRVLLVDEPTRGVDVGGRAAIHRLLRERPRGRDGVIFATSDLEELLELGDDGRSRCAPGGSIGVYPDGVSRQPILSDLTHRDGAAAAERDRDRGGAVSAIRRALGAPRRSAGQRARSPRRTRARWRAWPSSSSPSRTHRFLTWDNIKAIFSSASLVGIMALGLTFITLVGSIASLAVAPDRGRRARWSFLVDARPRPRPGARSSRSPWAPAVTALQGLLIGAWNANPVILTIGAGFLIDGFAAGRARRQDRASRPAAGTRRSIPRRSGSRSRSTSWWGSRSSSSSCSGAPCSAARSCSSARTGAPRGRPGFRSRGSSPPRSRSPARRFALGGAFLGAFNTGASTYLEGTLTFDAIAAVLVGGTSITGGRGSALRTLGGALAIAAISDVLLLRGFGTGAQILFKGVLVVAVVVVTQARLGGRERVSARIARGPRLRCGPSTCCRSSPSPPCSSRSSSCPASTATKLNQGTLLQHLPGLRAARAGRARRSG